MGSTTKRFWLGLLLLIWLGSAAACTLTLPTWEGGTPLPRTPTPTPPKIYLQDDFSTSKSGWPRQENDDVFMGYAIENYHIVIKQANRYFWSLAGKNYSDVVIEADMRNAGDAGGDMGIIFRYLDDKNFHAAVIANDGYYGIFRVRSGKMVLLGGLTQMRQHPAIIMGNETNHMKVECVGSKINLYANGALLGTANDLELFLEGRVGLFAGSYELPGVDIEFDNFLVRAP